MTNIILTIWSFCFTPQPARLWLMLVFSPDHGDVEVDPEEDVDDEDADGGLGELWDVPSVPFVLQPDIDPYHQENAWNEFTKCLQHKSNSFISFWMTFAVYFSFQELHIYQKILLLNYMLEDKTYAEH